MKKPFTGFRKGSLEEERKRLGFHPKGFISREDFVMIEKISSKKRTEEEEEKGMMKQWRQRLERGSCWIIT